MDMDSARYHLTEPKKENENIAAASPSKEAYKKLLVETCLNNRTRILAFNYKPPPTPPNNGFFSESSVSSHLVKYTKPRRYTSQTSERTLDAPDIMDDYSLNLPD